MALGLRWAAWAARVNEWDGREETEEERDERGVVSGLSRMMGMSALRMWSAAVLPTDTFDTFVELD